MRRLRAALDLPAVFGLACLTCLVACPPTGTTPTEITSAEVVGDPRSTIYVIRALGRGFLPSSLNYNLSSGTGSISSDYTLEVVRASDGRMTPSVHVDLLSTHELRAHLRIALEPGIYGVRLRRGSDGDVLAELEGAFQIEMRAADPDGGVDGGGDSGDSGDSGEDMNPIDATPDGGLAPDAEPAEEGADSGVAEDGGREDSGVPPDAGVPADSGLGPFAANFTARQEVHLINGSADVAPIGTTFLLPIPHATLLAAGFAKADATDFALYYGTTVLPYTWDDRTLIGTDQLAMIAELPEVIAAGAERDRTVPLILYYSDPAATIAPDDTSIFTFFEHFDAPLNSTTWSLRSWAPCNWDRSSEMATATPGAYCIPDGSGTQRVTISTPRITAIDQTIPANQLYVFSMFMSGVMSGANDLVYLSLNDQLQSYELSTLLAASDWVQYPPLDSITFTEVNNQQRTVDGWRFPTTRQVWTRAVARFRSPVDDPSFHMRFISTDATFNAATLVAIDDYSVRLALDVELVGTLDPREIR